MNIRDVPPEKVVINNFFISHPPEDEDRYRGQFVAWSRDGRKAFAAAPTMKALWVKCDELELGDDDFVTQFMYAG